jgi:hypothetical protein
LTGHAVQQLFATKGSTGRCGRRSNFKPLVFSYFQAVDDKGQITGLRSHAMLAAARNVERRR